MSDDLRRIKNWVGYSQEINRDVFCAALTGILANRSVNPMLAGIAQDAVKQANQIANEFFTQCNLNRG